MMTSKIQLAPDDGEFDYVHAAESAEVHAGQRLLERAGALQVGGRLVDPLELERRESVNGGVGRKDIVCNRIRDSGVGHAAP